MDAASASNQKIGSELVLEDEAFAEIVEDFLSGLDDRLKIMQDAMGSADFDALRVAAHQLKGSGGGYGYPMLTEEAGKLEKLATDSAADECREAVSQINALCARLVVSAD